MFLATVPALAQECGTPAEAKAMLEKAVAALKVDEGKALQMFTKGEGGFRDKDFILSAAAQMEDSPRIRGSSART